ncbi:MAG: hypothetical protein JNM74_20265 [Myxococcales bacterium]|nr:hypothetical protein [Myxococcales bacterium]
MPRSTSPKTRLAGLTALLVTSLTALGACSSDDGTTTPPAPAGFGGAVNDDWDLTPPRCTGAVTGGTFSSGAFSVTVGEGEISRCVNASAPSARGASKPAELPIGAGETIVTGGAEAYRLDLGERGFHTAKPGAVVVKVPFDAAKVPAASRSPRSVFLRLHDPKDHAVVDVTGRLEGDAVVAELRGLPASMDVVVVLNPAMRAVAIPAPKRAKAAVGHVTPETWGAHTFCVVYDPTEPSVVEATSQALRLNGPPSLTDIENVAKTKIGAPAAKAAQEYEATGFRQPDLAIGATEAEPCGGTDPRFFVHWLKEGNFFRSLDPAEVVAPDGNHYGRIYIATKSTTWTLAANRATVDEVIAHELFHAVQAGYALMAGPLGGYKEGTATTYGRSLALGAREAQVRSLSPAETFMLSQYLMISVQGSALPYSNQDFFAYVARAKNGGNLGYLTGTFNALHDAIERAAAALPTEEAKDALRWSPPRTTLLDAMDEAFRKNLGTDLRSEYVEFLRERAADHGPNGFFGREGEPQQGFARDLFVTDADPAKSARFETTIDPRTCTVTTPVFGLAQVAPLAARTVRLTPTATSESPVAIHVKVDGDGAGTRFGGIATIAGATQKLENETIVENFGKTNEPIDLVFANLDFGGRRDLAVRITCEAMVDTSVALAPFTWDVGDGHAFTVNANVSGPGIKLTAQETRPTLANVAEVELASSLPTSLGVALRVTPPATKTQAGTTTTYTIVGYAYQTKEPSTQPKTDTGATTRFTLDGGTTKDLGGGLRLFSADLVVKYRITSTYVDAEGATQTTSSMHELTALTLIAYVNVP